MKKTLAAGLVIFAFVFSSIPLASAQTMSATDEQALIQTLQAQILVLIQQINVLLQKQGAGTNPVTRPIPTSAPTVYSIYPTSGPIGTVVTVSHNLSGSIMVSFNGQLYQPLSIGNSTLTFAIPNVTPGSYGVSLGGTNALPFTVTSAQTTASPTVTLTANGTNSNGYQSPTVDVGSAQNVTFNWSSANSTYCNTYGQSKLLLTDGSYWNGTISTSGSKTFSTSGQKDGYGNTVNYTTVGVQCWNSNNISDSKGITITWSAGNTTTSNATPTISSISPNPVVPGAQLTVYGSGIDAITYVLFDGRIGIPANTHTSSSLAFTVPSDTSIGAHSVEILETSSSPKSNLVYATVSTGTTALAIPTISSVYPSSVVQGGQMTIYGSNFDPSTYVAIDTNSSGLGQSITPVSQTSSMLSFTLPLATLVGGHYLQVGQKASPLPVGYALFTVTAAQNPSASAVTLSANPSSVDTNKSTTLSWSANGPVTNCTITRKAASDTYVVNGNGSLTTLSLNANPAETFYISCSTPSGTTVSNTLSVPVNQNQTASSVTLTASPSTIAAGQSAALYYYETGGPDTTCSLNGQTLGLGSYGNGSISVSPTQTATYTFTCNSSWGSKSTNATVNVTQASTPVCTAAGIDTRTGFKCGCGSGSGFSTITGEACGFTAVAPTLDLLVNGSRDSVVLSNNASFSYNWTSTNATACQQVSPVYSGVFTNGSAGPVNPGHPYYPTSGNPSTITISCQGANGTSVSKSVMVSLASIGNTIIGVTPISPAPASSSTADPYSSPNYKQTGSTPLAGNEKSTVYSYPYSPCGSLMSQYTTPGSVSVGRGDVYNQASQACSSAGQGTPNESSFRVYACENFSDPSTFTVRGKATFAFTCNAGQSANSLDSIAALLAQIRAGVNSLSR